MKQEEEPWIDHLKQRVNEYEKPLPENDWNHFQTEYFTPYLHKKKRIRTMRIAAVLLLLFIPFATTFYFLQTEKHKVASPVVSLPAHQPRSITGNPSIMPENKLLPSTVKRKETCPSAVRFISDSSKPTSLPSHANAAGTVCPPNSVLPDEPGKRQPAELISPYE